MNHKTPNHLKIIGMIALKDISQSMKNKTVLGVIIGVFLLILPSQMIPLILQNESTPTAVVFSPKKISFIKEIAEDPNTRIYQVRSIEEMKDEIVSGRQMAIGLVFSEEFSDTDDYSKISVDAYFPHWTKAENFPTLIKHFESLIYSVTQREVEIQIADDQVHPDEDSRGSEVMFILQMINAIITISLVLVPQLFMVEKESHTLDALMTSPANFNDIVLGKGLAGCFYGLTAALIVILLNTRLIAHWGLLILAVISGVVFAVLLGLLMGLLFDNFQQATLAFSIIVILAIAPAFIKLILTVNFPSAVEVLINWLPSGKLADLLQMSVFREIDIPQAISGFAAIWGVNLALLFWVLLKIRHERLN